MNIAERNWWMHFITFKMQVVQKQNKHSFMDQLLVYWKISKWISLMIWEAKYTIMIQMSNYLKNWELLMNNKMCRPLVQLSTLMYLNKIFIGFLKWLIFVTIETKHAIDNRGMQDPQILKMLQNNQTWLSCKIVDDWSFCPLKIYLRINHKEIIEWINRWDWRIYWNETWSNWKSNQCFKNISRLN